MDNSYLNECYWCKDYFDDDIIDVEDKIKDDNNLVYLISPAMLCNSIILGLLLCTYFFL